MHITKRDGMLLAGLIGRGGGSFVVPLLSIVGLAKMAAATFALVVTFSGSSSFMSHLVTAVQPDWVIWIVCAVAALVGSHSRLEGATRSGDEESSIG